MTAHAQRRQGRANGRANGRADASKPDTDVDAVRPPASELRGGFGGGRMTTVGVPMERSLHCGESTSGSSGGWVPSASAWPSS